MNIHNNSTLPGVNKKDVIPSQPKYIKQGGCVPALGMLFIIICVILSICTLMSCRTSKNITSQQSNTDSSFREAADDSFRLLAAYRENYERVLKQLTETGVIFENDPCPNLDSIFSVLDKVNKARVDSMISKENIKIKSLTNKLEVAADGSFKAEGRIAAYKRKEETYEKEVREKNDTIDILKKSLREKEVELSKKVEIRERIIEKKFIPWWIYLVMVGAAGLVWVVRGRMKSGFI